MSKIVNKVLFLLISLFIFAPTFISCDFDFDAFDITNDDQWSEVTKNLSAVGEKFLVYEGSNGQAMLVSIDTREKILSFDSAQEIRFDMSNTKVFIDFGKDCKKIFDLATKKEISNLSAFREYKKKTESKKFVFFKLGVDFYLDHLTFYTVSNGKPSRTICQFDNVDYFSCDKAKTVNAPNGAKKWVKNVALYLHDGSMKIIEFSYTIASVCGCSLDFGRSDKVRYKEVGEFGPVNKVMR